MSRQKKAFRHLVAKLIIATGITERVVRRLSAEPSILPIYFHAPDEHLFSFCVRWLLSKNFRFLSEADIYDIYKKRVPFPKRSVFISVDDGWQSNWHNVVQVVEKYGVPITLFVATNAVEEGNFWWSVVERYNESARQKVSIAYLKTVPNAHREVIVDDLKKQTMLQREALTPEQLQAISVSKYVSIGSHSVSHPILVQCPDEMVREELAASKKKIERWINAPVNCFAYPNGDYGKREISMLQNLGYRSAYTTKPALITPGNINQIFELPRFCVIEDISDAEAICRMTGVWQSMFKRSKS